MKKKYKVIMMIMAVWMIFIIVDFTLSAYDKRPIFSIPIKVYKDGGTVEYCGLGYKVIKYNTIDDKKTNEVGRKDADFGFWTLKYNK